MSTVSDPSFALASWVGADHVVYIPTNRDAAAAIHSTAREIAAVNSHAQQATAFIVIDNSPGQITTLNRNAAASATAATGVPITVLDEAGWAELRATLCSRLPHTQAMRAEKLLCFVYPSYGAGPIKASLLACSAGARTLHRRDSDQVVDPTSTPAPFAVELNWLGCHPPSSLIEDSSRRVRAVGSSLRGEPSRDRRDLDAIDKRFGARLDRAHGSSGARRSVTHAAVAEADGARLNEDRSGQVEMGICALTDVFAWIPEMPATSIFGVDYMQKNLVYQIGDVVLHHDRQALHEYDAMRASQASEADVRTYVLAELRYAYIRPIWNAANTIISTLDLPRLEPQPRADAYVSAWRSHLDGIPETSAAIQRLYIEIYRDAVDAATDPAIRQRLQWRLEAIRDEGASAASDSARALSDFLGLVELWPMLCESARGLRDDI